MYTLKIYLESTQVMTLKFKTRSCTLSVIHLGGGGEAKRSKTLISFR